MKAAVGGDDASRFAADHAQRVLHQLTIADSALAAGSAHYCRRQVVQLEAAKITCAPLKTSADLTKQGTRKNQRRDRRCAEHPDGGAWRHDRRDATRRKTVADSPKGGQRRGL